MNVKKTISLFLLLAVVGVTAACGGSGATPTRTRVAEADATQTPWIIIVPVTVTPGPATATLEPTSTPSQPEPTAVPPTNTRRPATEAPPAQPTEPPPPAQPTAPPEAATPEPPAATAPANCGASYQVMTLIDPSPNGVVRDASSGSGAGKTLRFNWTPVENFELGSDIGYRVNVRTPVNSVALYISHNAFLKERVVILGQQATYGLTQGDDATASWNVDVIKASGEFNDVGDDTQPPLGSVAVCGASSETWTIQLHVIN